MTPGQEEKLNNLCQSVERIEIFLRGDKNLDTGGMKQTVDWHTKKIREFERDKVKVVTGATIFGAIGAAIAGYIKYLIYGNH